jgi:hypothetical protein
MSKLPSRSVYSVVQVRILCHITILNRSTYIGYSQNLTNLVINLFHGVVHIEIRHPHIRQLILLHLAERATIWGGVSVVDADVSFVRPGYNKTAKK